MQPQARRRRWRWYMRLRNLVLVAALASLVSAAPAAPSQLVDRDARDVTLRVDARGRALVSYTARGRRWNVLAWGAVNAIAPAPGARQVALTLDYAAGWGTYKQDLSKGFANTCGPYTGPPLAWLVTACTARDGSHWALQSWQRMLPNYGLVPSAQQAAWELRLSHWTGPLPQLTVKLNWAYRTYDHLFGSFAYAGVPVYGFSSTSTGVPLDTFGRNLYVDTFNSAYGPGWRRENSFLTHMRTGIFCYGFFPHGARPLGKGERYRATIIGPGVTPDVMWQAPALGPYDKSLDVTLSEEQRALYGSDRLCKPV